MKTVKLTLMLLLLITSMIKTHAMTPEAYLQFQAQDAYAQKHYFSNIFLGLSGGLYTSSLLVKDPEIQESNASLAMTYAVVGAALRLLPNKVETEYKKTELSTSYSATKAIKEIQKSQKYQRYLAGTLFLIPLFLDFSGEKTEGNPHPNDANITTKFLFGTASLCMVAFKTPFEKTSEQVLKQNQLSFNITPTPTDITLSATYFF